jgi:hypothetical protein
MFNLLFLFGLLVGIAGGVIVVAGLFAATVAAVRWMNVLVAMLVARFKERESTLAPGLERRRLRSG